MTRDISLVPCVNFILLFGGGEHSGMKRLGYSHLQARFSQILQTFQKFIFSPVGQGFDNLLLQDEADIFNRLGDKVSDGQIPLEILERSHGSDDAPWCDASVEDRRGWGRFLHVRRASLVR